MKRLKKPTLVIIGFCFFFLSLNSATYTNQDNIWPKASMKEVGFNEAKIEKLTQLLLNNTIKNIHSLLIIKEDRTVYEKYFNSFKKDKPHPIYSVTKSVSSALIGIALETVITSGYGGQKIYVFPAIDMMVVITSGNYGRNQTIAHIQTDVMVKYHILRALEQAQQE